ncbi:sec-independent protein translocase protein TatB [Kitasatospora sp. GP30]|uniref:sec-independent translocase n=1 Tax=Kitasatospora sp. GP30 TaxID=3035084 RepID=UPI000C70E56B|nr:sec-independent translocase [Kitasatospora sp. GP30]MDH6141750.1 sec-independent protein translocase protein TatB [Kitasatospora sp. GP30]
MFFDIGPLEMITLVVMAVIIFGPDKLPKLIQDSVGFIRKIRSFADGAKADIRKELGPEFKDFEFEDLNPKTFVRKNLIGDGADPLGFKEINDSLGIDTLRQELDVRSVLDDKPATPLGTKPLAAAGGHRAAPDTGTPLAAGERAPFDPDAT